MPKNTYLFSCLRMIKMPHSSFIFMCLFQNELTMKIKIFKPIKTTSVLLCFHCAVLLLLKRLGSGTLKGIVTSWGPPLAVDMERSSRKPSGADGSFSGPHGFCCFVFLFLFFLIPHGAIAKMKTNQESFEDFLHVFLMLSKMPQSEGRWNFYNFKSENKTVQNCETYEKNKQMTVASLLAWTNNFRVWQASSQPPVVVWNRPDLRIEHTFISLESPFELKV